jgi:surface carbohydrate biosynthesis protein
VSKILKFLLHFKLRIMIPSEKKIIVFDPATSFHLYKILSQYEYTFLKARKEEINLYVLLLTILRFWDYQNLTFYQKYLINQIKIINPKIIITCTSHNSFLLSLKKFFPNLKIVVIQHASLSEITLNEILAKCKKDNLSRKYKIDYVCTFGASGRDFYSKFVDAKEYIITGSIKNNYFKEKKVINDKVVFISQFRFRNGKMRQIITKKYEKFLFKNLRHYCENMKKKLYVLSCNQTRQNEEKSYFDRVIGKGNYKFLHKLDWSSSYKYALNYKFFITHSSTLGWELMARGKRTAFLFEFHRRVKKNKSPYSTFYAKNYNGPFWTNTYNSKKLKKILDNSFYCNQLELEKNKKKFINPLVIYNKDNLILKNLIKKIY